MDNPDSDDYELTSSRELDELRHDVSSLKKNSMVEGDKARMLIESMDRLTIAINRFVTILNDAQKDIIDEYQDSKPTEKLNQLLEQSETIAKVLLSMNENMSNSSNSRSPIPTPSTSYSSNNSSNNAYSQSPAQNSQNLQNSPSQAYSPLPTPNYSPSTQNYSSQPAYSQPSTQAYSSSSYSNMSPLPQQNTGLMNDPRNPLPIPIPPSANNQFMGPQSMNQQPMNPPPMSYNPSMDNSSISLGDDFPPMEDIPPLDGGMPNPAPNVPKKKFLGIM